MSFSVIGLPVDMNQCSTDNGGCDHTCTDLIPGYQCSCDDGFELSSDDHSCDGKLHCMSNEGLL